MSGLFWKIIMPLLHSLRGRIRYFLLSHPKLLEDFRRSQAISSFLFDQHYKWMLEEGNRNWDNESDAGRTPIYDGTIEESEYDRNIDIITAAIIRHARKTQRLGLKYVPVKRKPWYSYDRIRRFLRRHPNILARLQRSRLLAVKLRQVETQRALDVVQRRHEGNIAAGHVAAGTSLSVDEIAKRGVRIAFLEILNAPELAPSPWTLPFRLAWRYIRAVLFAPVRLWNYLASLMVLLWDFFAASPFRFAIGVGLLLSAVGGLGIWLEVKLIGWLLILGSILIVAATVIKLLGIFVDLFEFFYERSIIVRSLVAGAVVAFWIASASKKHDLTVSAYVLLSYAVIILLVTKLAQKIYERTHDHWLMRPEKFKIALGLLIWGAFFYLIHVQLTDRWTWEDLGLIMLQSGLLVGMAYISVCAVAAVAWWPEIREKPSLRLNHAHDARPISDQELLAKGLSDER
jgi:hypothetical protein